MPHSHSVFSRRRALCCGAAAVAGLFTSMVTSPAQAAPAALVNRCAPPSPLPPELADWLAPLWQDIDATQMWDAHTHLLGNGDAGSGCRIHPSLIQGWHVMERTRRLVFMNAACVSTDAPSVDRAYVQRLQSLAEGFPPGARWLLFAFEHAHGEDGRAQPENSTFHVPNAYARQTAEALPERFGWVASIHPYREDAVAQLDAAIAHGALAVKWLPSAMNIDLRSPRLRPFYARLASSRLPLIVHAGEEKAVPGAGRDDLGNPLHARHALRAGVRVILAHCASLGEALDLDARRPAPVSAFSLFARLMDEAEFAPLLLGDISAVFQSNRRPEVWTTLLKRQEWHPRLLHGSDYPLPGVPWLQRPGGLLSSGLMTPGDADKVAALRHHNPLLADLALKRLLSHQGARLDLEVFHTRRHFVKSPA